MNLGQLASVLTEAAKMFAKEKLPNKLTEIGGVKITNESVQSFLEFFLKQVTLPADIGNVMQNRLIKYIEQGVLESIKRNNHMNDYIEGDTFDIISADAILVDFVNYACMPLDLGMYTLDLRKEVAA